MVAEVYDLNEIQIEGFEGKVTGDDLAWLPSFPADTPDEVLLKEYAEKGVVHIKGVMPRDYVQAHRKRAFEFLSDTGVLKEGSDPTDGIFGNGKPEDFLGADVSGYADEISPAAQRYIGKMYEIAQSPWGAEFCSNKYILAMVKRIMPDWTSPFCYKRQIWRTNMPNLEGPITGVHYDHIFLRGGPPSALTAWVPVGDCGPLMGGLIYFEDSLGVAEGIENDFTRRAMEDGMSEEEAMYAFNKNMETGAVLSRDVSKFQKDYGEGRRRWLIANYEAGDAVFHHSYSIHSSSTNHDPEGRIRLSCDLRYADADRPHDPRWNMDCFKPGDGL